MKCDENIAEEFSNVESRWIVSVTKYFTLLFHDVKIDWNSRGYIIFVIIPQC